MSKKLILHGEDIVSSRQFLGDLKSQLHKQGIADIFTLDGRQISLNQVLQAVESDSLFGTGKAVIIENIFNKSTNEQKEILNFLGSAEPFGSHLVIWEAKTLSAAQLKKLSGFDSRLFKMSPVIFKFLDNLIPGKQAVFLPLLSQALAQNTPESILYLIARQVRLLLSVDSPELKLPPWQKQKLISQRRQSSDVALLKLHRLLVDFDWASKSGGLISSPEIELRFILAQYV